MKFYKNIFLIVAGFILMITTSCKKTFFTDINNNPNVPSSVSPALILSTTETALAYTQGGDLSRFSSLFMQQVLGTNSQSQAYYQYGLNSGAFDNLWPDIYTSVMENDDTLMHESDKNGYNAYSGISRIIMAYTLQITVDAWGSVPYSQALAGNANLHPGYDNDKALYDTIASLVDVGIAQLSNTDADILIPGPEDFIYKGDASKWIKFGHAIKARLYIHQSKGNADMATKALAEISQSFESNDDNATYFFGTSETAANPWYQFFTQRPGDEQFEGSTLSQMLSDLNDPRYPLYNLDSTDANGNNTGYYDKINSPVEFITYDELQFVKAEATLRTSGNYAEAQTYFQNAIKANMDKLGISPTTANTYVVANGTLPTTSVDAAISKLANQEYIALFLNPETWTLWRRTGSPDLQPVSGTAIPRRLLYPQSEISFNGANTPSSVTLFSPKIFWDK